MAVTRMAILQEAARRKMEAERIRRKPRSRMQRAIDKPNSSFNLLMIGTVSLSVLLFMLETEASVVCALGRTGRNVWWWIEALCIALFTAEVLARLGLVVTEPGKSCSGRAKGCLRMLIQPMTVVDIVALVPFYTGLYMIAIGTEEATAAAELCAPNETVEAGQESSENNLAFLAFLRVFRLARVFRILRLARRMSGVTVFTSALSRSVPQLSAIFFFLLLTILVTSCAIFYTEETWKEDPGEAYVDANFGHYIPYHSIPGALWFSLVTITAVGYGEFFPVTPAGRTVAAIVALVSQIIFALPITVIGSNYATAYREQARLRLIDQLQTQVELKFRELNKAAEVLSHFGKVRKQFWNLPDGVQMQKSMLQELLTGRQGKKKRKPSKDQTDLWEVICGAWDELYWGSTAIDEDSLKAVLDQVRLGEAQQLSTMKDDGLGGPEASAPGKGADRRSGQGQGWGAASKRLAGIAEAKHRRELLEFCRSAATLLAEHKPEAGAEGVPIAREGEPPVEFIQ